MARSVRLAADLGMSGSIDMRRRNIFDTQQMAELRDELVHDGGLPKLVDAMGIFEYTGENIGVDPISFLRSIWECVDLGGTLILGQMRADRPVPDYTLGVIQWPYIEMRSLDELMSIIVAAGIAPENVELFLPTDGVYAVVAIDKSDTGS